MFQKNIVRISAIGVCLYLISRYAVRLSLCSYTDPACVFFWDSLEKTTLFFVVVLFFSILSRQFGTLAFTAWWRFARIAIPAILLISLALNLELHHSAYGDLQNIFDIPILVTLYTVFILGSLWQIVRNRG